MNRLQATARPYDLVLLDWRMPGLSGIETARRMADLPPAQQPIRLLLVTGYDTPELRAEALGAGFAGVVIKPVTPSDLYRGLSQLLAGAPPPAPSADRAEPEAMAMLLSRYRGARVLLAEDDPVNQEVGLGLLGAVGLAVDVAGDGAQAVAMVQRNAYALILMDMQMPELDGLTATRAIRALPTGHAVPIVAMTANAFVEDRDHCLAAGMNDFVAKPVDPAVLYDILLHWLSCAPAAPDPLPSTGAVCADARTPDLSHPPDAIRDIAAYRRLLSRFAESYQEAGQDLGALLERGERAAAAVLAHKLKGAAGALALTDVARAAALIDQELKAGRAPEDGGQGLQQALKAAVGAIRRVADPPQDTLAPASVDSTVVGPLLRELLRALDRDTPDQAEPVLAALAAVLPNPQWCALRAHVDGFDFRAAEAEVAVVAAALGIDLSLIDRSGGVSWMNSRPILCVDDDPANLAILRETLKDEYSLVFACSGLESLHAVDKHRPSLILLDVQLPDLDGYAICRRLKAQPDTADIPVIFVTGQTGEADEQAGFDAGGVDYVTKPVRPSIVRARVRAHLSLVSAARLEQAYRDAIYMLGAAGHYNDSDTGMHIWRMAAYSRELAKAAGWEPECCALLELAAAMHDTGKIGIPTPILNKPGKLDPAEWEIMKTHARIGHEILSRSQAPLFQLAAEVALCHHERWDGSGYPQGLAGIEIPESARIIAVADVFDALSMQRPYKKSWPVDEILELLDEGAGHHFDPRMVRLFMSILPAIIEIGRQWDARGDDFSGAAALWPRL